MRVSSVMGGTRARASGHRWVRASLSGFVARPGLEDYVPVRVEQGEPLLLLALERLLVRVEPRGDLRVAVLLHRRPVAVRDRHEHVPVRPAVAVEPWRPELDVREPAGRELFAEDRPMVLAEQRDELVVRAPARSIEVQG